jgi:type IV secretion system protein TrbL
VLLVARGAVLVVLAGVLPLTAAATNTDTGRAVFVRTLTWILAFTLYQPAAALVYSAAFLLPAPSDAPLVSALTGVTFLAMAIAALPALLRLLRPVLRSATLPAGRHRATSGGLPTGARAVMPATGAGGVASASSIRVTSTRGGGGSGSAAVAIPGSLRMRPGRLGRSTGMTVLDVAPGAQPVPASGESRVARTVAALPGPRTDEEERVR